MPKTALPTPSSASTFASSTYALALRRKGRWTALMLALIIGTVLALAQRHSMFISPDRWLYDRALHWALPLHALPGPKPILIEIDERSLAQLGRWPWDRGIHARLVKRLSEAPPQVLGFDVVFAQAQVDGVLLAQQDGDRQFAQAISAATYPIVLASQLELDGPRSKLVRPEAPLSTSTARLAHIHATPDTDGTVRSIHVQEGFDGYVPLPYLGYALHLPRSAQRMDTGQQTLTAGLPSLAARSADSTQNTLWKASRPTLLYPMKKAAFEAMPYVDLLNGKITPDQWQGRQILVAANAAGLGDQYVSPIYGASTLMPGGEIVMAMLHTQQQLAHGAPPLREAPPWWAWVVGMVAGMLMLAAMRGLPLWGQVLCGLGILFIAGLGSGLLFASTGWWMSPAAAWFSASAAFAAWLLLRMSTVLRTGHHFNAASLGTLMGGLPAQDASLIPPPAAPLSYDPVDAHLLRQAAHEQAQTAIRNTLVSVLQVLPDAAIVLAPRPDGHSGVWLANDAARRFIQVTGAGRPSDLPSYSALLAPFRPLLTPAQHNALGTAVFQWALLLLRDVPNAFTAGVEARLLNGARYLVKMEALRSAMGTQTPGGTVNLLPEQAFVLTLIDLSISQQLAAQRDASLQFLSHDLRSPQAAIVAMLEMEAAQHPQAQALLTRIGNEAQRTLNLAEAFVQLARAEQTEIYRFTPYDLNDLAIEAADELWAPAKQRGIRITTTLHDAPLIIQADRTMLWRAVVNLLSNAVRYSPADTSITLHSQVLADCAQLTVSDHGRGIDAPVLARLFERFNQGDPPNTAINTNTDTNTDVCFNPDTNTYVATALPLSNDAGTHTRCAQGAGLGLSFVKTVLEQHGGSVGAISPCYAEPTPHGTQFVLRIPWVETA